MPKAYIVQDKYFERAKKLGYRARSVFKLKELQTKFQILKPGMTVLDLGASPGSWSQYTEKIIGPAGRALGIDLSPIEPVGRNITLLQADIFSAEAEDFIKQNAPEKFDVILSDLAPHTSGIKETDHYRSLELNERVLALSEKFLKPGGTIVMKIFQGPDFDHWFMKLKKQYRQAKIFKPQASRDRSFEVYVVVRQ